MEQGQISLTIDGKECVAKEGQSIVQAARENGLFIPTLCDFRSLSPAGTCRVCTVKVGGRFVPGCTSPAVNGMVVENETAELTDLRRALVEMLIVEGNHMCPSCEKSGNCELQELAHHYRIVVPRYPFLFPVQKVEARMAHLFIEHKRCIQCLRCVRGVRAKDGHEIFGFMRRGSDVRITVDVTDPEAVSEATAKKAMEICPVGALIQKRVGFRVPIGQRRFDRKHEKDGKQL